MVQSSNDPRKEAAALKSRVGNNVGDPWTSAFWRLGFLVYHLILASMCIDIRGPIPWHAHMFQLFSSN